MEDQHFVKATAAAQIDARRQLTDEERTEDERLRAIRSRAMRLAVPKVAGTPLEGRAFWPTGHWVNPVADIGDGKFLVALLIEVTEEQLQHHLAEAEMMLAAEAAEAAKADSADEQIGDDDDIAQAAE